MRFLLLCLLTLSNTACQAQMQKWQRDRTVDHLSRLKNYHGQLSWEVAGEKGETEIWFEAPNRFLTISKNGEVARSDGATMEFFDPKSKFHVVFAHLPPVTDSDNTQLIRALFDRGMKDFSFTLGALGSVAGRNVIALHSSPKQSSLVEHGEAQIFDEYSFPLKSVIKFRNGQIARYEFSKITINEKFELPKAKIPTGAYKIEWDFQRDAQKSVDKPLVFQDLKLDKILKRETGETLSYYRSGALFASVLRYKNFGAPPQSRGVKVNVGPRVAYLFPGPLSSTVTLTEGDTTSLYTSNLPVDDLVSFAAHPAK